MYVYKYVNIHVYIHERIQCIMSSDLLSIMLRDNNAQAGPMLALLCILWVQTQRSRHNSCLLWRPADTSHVYCPVRPAARSLPGSIPSVSFRELPRRGVNSPQNSNDITLPLCGGSSILLSSARDESSEQLFPVFFWRIL